MKSLKVGIASYADMKARTSAIARGELKPRAGEPKVWFTSIESFAKVLSDRNRALLNRIVEEEPESLTALARISGRAKSNLSRTLHTLERYGLVYLEKGRRGRILPRVPYSRIVLETPITTGRRASVRFREPDEGKNYTVMTKRAKQRVTVINTPKVIFTPAVTKDDLERVHQSPIEFGPSEIQNAVYTEENDGRKWSRHAKITLRPDQRKRWSYSHTLEIYTGMNLDRGRCVRASWLDANSLAIQWNDFSWDLESTMVKRHAILNMKGAEHAHWLMRLMHTGRNPHVQGYTPDTTQRIFRYAVPLTGLSNEDTGQLVGQSDFGLTSADPKDQVNQLIKKLTEGVDDASWNTSVPKVYGAVVANTPVEAEAHALQRARFAADVITFALQSGASHFDTSHNSTPLEWEAIESIGPVSTKPWIVLFEDRTRKGWVRPVPLTHTERPARLKATRQRLQLFMDRFRRVAKSGDIADQLEARTRSARENRIARAVQTAVYWLAVAARMPEDEYRLIPVWTALEAVLNAIKYPPLFGGKHEDIKKTVLKTIDEIDDNGADAAGTGELKSMLKGRLGDNNRPIPRRLEPFSKEFGITLQEGDFDTVKNLAGVRNQMIHKGETPAEDLRCQIAQLKYLVERLVMAASVCAVRASKGASPHRIKIVGVEPGTTGAAKIYIDGKEVSYTLTFRRQSDGTDAMTIVSDGLIYDESNSVVE